MRLRYEYNPLGPWVVYIQYNIRAYTIHRTQRNNFGLIVGRQANSVLHPRYAEIRYWYTLETLETARNGKPWHRKMQQQRKQ